MRHVHCTKPVIQTMIQGTKIQFTSTSIEKSHWIEPRLTREVQSGGNDGPCCACCWPRQSTHYSTTLQPLIFKERGPGNRRTMIAVSNMQKTDCTGHCLQSLLHRLIFGSRSSHVSSINKFRCITVTHQAQHIVDCTPLFRSQLSPKL